MQAHEIRVNNHLEFYENGTHSTGKIKAINSIHKTVLIQDSRINKLMHFSFLKYIPITKQSLIDLGFTKSKVSEWYHIEDFQIEIVVDEENKFIFCVVNGFVLRHLKYIHQLQNLYFDITQKELTFKTK